MSELLEQYLDLQGKWSAAACAGNMEEYQRLGDMGKAVREKFTADDWKELIAQETNIQAKIFYKKQLQEKFPEKTK